MRNRTHFGLALCLALSVVACTKKPVKIIEIDPLRSGGTAGSEPGHRNKIESICTADGACAHHDVAKGPSVEQAFMNALSRADRGIRDIESGVIPADQVASEKARIEEALRSAGISLGEVDSKPITPVTAENRDILIDLIQLGLYDATEFDEPVIEADLRAELAADRLISANLGRGDMNRIIGQLAKDHDDNLDDTGKPAQGGTFDHHRIRRIFAANKITLPGEDHYPVGANGVLMAPTPSGGISWETDFFLNYAYQDLAKLLAIKNFEKASGRPTRIEETQMIFNEKKIN